MFDPKISAKLVHVEGDEDVVIPPEMGTPRDDQMQGTPRERLCELSGRACYSSLGSGRNSADYHENLINQKHLSVYEHAWFSYVIPYYSDFAMPALYLFSRLRGGDVIEVDSGFKLRFNVRHVYDMNVPNAEERLALFDYLDRFIELREILSGIVIDAMPMLEPMGLDASFFDDYAYDDGIDEHTCVSMYLQMSRGASHEQVRHRFAVSQRSTRFVDESLSPYITHPVITKYLGDREMINDDGNGYDTTVAVLSGALERNGVPKVHARKQARGAARSYLRTSLATEMIFTAPIWGWQHMLKMRMTDSADAEIRVLYNRILDELCVNERVAPFFGKFKNYEKPATDGCGMVLN